MCGLSGEITFDGSLADTGAVDRMVCALVPRGPDGQGSWSAGRVAFGHRRLSVIDLSTAGGQPMVDSELGLTAVFNGCIYDYQELRAELEGHGYRFFSTSDTEVLIKGYHHWGLDFVDHLHGMFAVVIHERDTGRVVMARDRLGIKPLYLAETPQRLRFASSLPALLRAGGVDTSIDPVALHHYLTWHAVVPAPRTILDGVRKLPPATVRVVEPDEFRYSDVIAERFATDHHRIRVGSDELVGALGHAVGAMSEPMVSHDVVAFDLLSEHVSQTIRVVQSGQGADEVFAGYHWYPPLAGLDREAAIATYAERFFDRDGAAMREVVADRYRVDGDPSLE